MSDVVDIKINWEFILLGEGQAGYVFTQAFNDFPMTMQIDSTTWDEMSSEDREECIVNDLWERCRTNIVKMKE